MDRSGSSPNGVENAAHGVLRGGVFVPGESQNGAVWHTLGKKRWGRSDREAAKEAKLPQRDRMDGCRSVVAGMICKRIFAILPGGLLGVKGLAVVPVSKDWGVDESRRVNSRLHGAKPSQAESADPRACKPAVATASTIGS